MRIPLVRVAREEMRKRVAYYKDLKGYDGGLPDSNYPGAERTLYNAIGFVPKAVDSCTQSDDKAEIRIGEGAIRIREGFNLGFCETLPGKGPLMHNHDTNETLMPLTGTWRCEWEVDGKVEFFDIGPWDVFSFPPGVNRRFENVTSSEPDKSHVLLFIVAGDQPDAEFSEGAKEKLAAAGLL